ncbi:MAG TPA: hypothetical protein VKB78_10005 [Pirellulales bacterium]|nr:hypothetical protein [Pirellulales bacterium]
MVFDQIETLKRDYTDKYVVVDESRPELARFRGFVGQVKTINMNGRALVEFQEYIANIGWYDIDLDFLTVVPKPEPAAVAKEAKPARKEAPAKAAPAAVAKPAEAASAKPAAKPPAAPGEKKLSPIELARMQGAAKREGAAPVAKAKPTSDAGKPAAEAAKPAGKKPSTADILAAARSKRAPAPEATPAEAPTGGNGERAAGQPAAAPVAAAAAAPTETEPSSVVREKAVVAKEAPAKPAAAQSPAGGWTKLATTAEKVDWCRTNDQGRNAR